MKLAISAGILVMAVATPASAALIVNADGSVTTSGTSGGTATINFDGFGGNPPSVISGLGSSLKLTFVSIVGNTYNFSYDLKNSSTLSGTRVSSFGFNTDPNLVGGSVSGGFDTFSTDVNYPVGFGTVEACAYDGPQGTCTGNGNGPTVGQSVTGNLALTFASGTEAVTLSDFVVRYQAFNSNGITSAIGRPVVGAVPEPATWAMMLIGFGLLGGFMRRRKSADRVHVGYA